MLSTFRIQNILRKTEAFMIHRNALQIRYAKRTPLYQNDPVKDKITLCVVGNGSEGSPSSVCLDYKDKYFLFSCGEGTTRRMLDLG